MTMAEPMMSPSENVRHAVETRRGLLEGDTL
jgi:hypothetical protein